MTRSVLSTRFAARVGVAALSVATVAALAVPAASADEVSSSSESPAESSAPTGDAPGAPTDPEAPSADGSDTSTIVSSVVGTDWGALIRVLAALSTGMVSSSTLADAVSLSADSPVNLGDVIGSAGGPDGSDTEGPDVPTAAPEVATAE